MNASKPLGHVVSLRAGGDDNQVMVEVEAGVTCERCASGKGCGAGLLGGAPQSKIVSAIIDTNLILQCGDQVSLELRPANVLRGALIVYGYPFAGAISGAMIASLFGFADAAAVIAVGMGLVAGFFGAKFRVSGDRCLRDFTPVVVEKLAGSGSRC